MLGLTVCMTQYGTLLTTNHKVYSEPSVCVHTCSVCVCVLELLHLIKLLIQFFYFVMMFDDKERQRERNFRKGEFKGLLELSVTD